MSLDLVYRYALLIVSFPTRMTQPVGGFLTSMTQED